MYVIPPPEPKAKIKINVFSVLRSIAHQLRSTMEGKTERRVLRLGRKVASKQRKLTRRYKGVRLCVSEGVTTAEKITGSIGQISESRWMYLELSWTYIMCLCGVPDS